jgi:ribosomal protein S27E
MSSKKFHMAHIEIIYLTIFKNRSKTFGKEVKMTIQEAMGKFSKPWMQEFFAMPETEQAKFFMAWYMAVASLREGKNREIFTDALITAIRGCEKKAGELKFVEIKCATCENTMEVPDHCSDKIHLCVTCREKSMVRKEERAD